MIYFYDFENLSIHGFEGYENLIEEDTLVVFYSEKNKQWDIDLSLELIQNCKANLKFIKTTKSMPNYADFQICTLLGACIKEGNTCSIISGDKGYVSVIDYWKEDKYFGNPSVVQLASSLKGIKKDKGGNIALEKIIPENKVNDSETTNSKSISKIVATSRNLETLRYNLKSEFGNKEGQRIYNSVKEDFKRRRRTRAK